MISFRNFFRSTIRLTGRVVVALLLAVFLMIGFVYYYFDFPEPEHLADEELIQRFHQSHASFERLIQMEKEDRELAMVSEDRTTPERPSDITPERIAEYRRFLKDAGPRPWIEMSADRTQVKIGSTSRGFVTHGAEKGYLYAEKTVDEKDLMPDLDRFSKDEKGFGLRHIEGHWYLFFEGY